MVSHFTDALAGIKVPHQHPPVTTGRYAEGRDVGGRGDVHDGWYWLWRLRFLIVPPGMFRSRFVINGLAVPVVMHVLLRRRRRRL